MTLEKNTLTFSDLECRILVTALQNYAAEEAPHGTAGRIVSECAEELITRIDQCTSASFNGAFERQFVRQR